MPHVTILERRRREAADDLAAIIRESEQLMAADGWSHEDPEYVALRERATSVRAVVDDIDARMTDRALAERPAPAATVNGQPISDFQRVLREYDRGHSERVRIPYDLRRELQTGDEYFTPNPTRVTVAQLPTITPSLDAVTAVPVGSNAYDFTVPPPVVKASTVAEGGQKPTRTWDAAKVSGTLETDAHLVDVTRQTLEDDASAERTLRGWLTEGVRAQQDAKVAAAIAGATGTQVASGSGVLGALRAGKSELTSLGVIPTQAHLNPADAATADLDAMTNGHTGPEGLAVSRGMPVVENPAVAVGAPIVGSMRQAVYFLYRNAIQTYITDSGMTQEATPRDRFSHNLLGILSEGRSRAHVVQPGLLVKCTVTALQAASAKRG